MLTPSSALYLRNDPYENSDAVFGVKDTLVVDLLTVGESEIQKYNVAPGTKLIKYDFVLVEADVALQLKLERAKEAMSGKGNVEFINGLHVPALD
jgi:hypothetical protein